MGQPPRKSKRKAFKAKNPRPRKHTPLQTFKTYRKKKLPKLPKPGHPKRRGALTMRGAEGIERSLSVRQFWEQVHKADLLHRIERTLSSLSAAIFRIRPTFYTRFTFTVSKVTDALLAGSPKLLTSQKRSVKAWFFASGLSYTLTSAFYMAEKAIDDIENTIRDAQVHARGEAIFFLEFVTCRAYVVKE